MRAWRSILHSLSLFSSNHTAQSYMHNKHMLFMITRLSTSSNDDGVLTKSQEDFLCKNLQDKENPHRIWLYSQLLVLAQQKRRFQWFKKKKIGKLKQHPRIIPIIIIRAGVMFPTVNLKSGDAKKFSLRKKSTLPVAYK